MLINNKGGECNITSNVFFYTICVHLLQLEKSWCDTVHIYCSITCISFNIPKDSQWHSRVVTCFFTWKLKILLHLLFCPLEAAAEFKPNSSVRPGAFYPLSSHEMAALLLFLAPFLVVAETESLVSKIVRLRSVDFCCLFLVKSEVSCLYFGSNGHQCCIFFSRNKFEQMYFTDSHLGFKILRIGWGILSTHNL